MRKFIIKFCLILVFFIVSLSLISGSAEAGVVESAIRTNPGFNSNMLAPNDDGSTGLIPIGFESPINFFGDTFSGLYVNNNGGITFDSPLSTYTPFSLTATERKIIAPFFADVDTRSVGSPVKYGTDIVDGHPAFGVNWIDVNCYHPNNVGPVGLNKFQLVLIDRSDRSSGDFDIEFNYDQILWETGTASGGNSMCLGGGSARAGFSQGTGDPGTFFELPGSGVPGAFLDGGPASTALIHNSLDSPVLGRYIFEVQNGDIPVSDTTPPEIISAEIINPTQAQIVYSEDAIITGEIGENYDSLVIDDEPKTIESIDGSGTTIHTITFSGESAVNTDATGSIIINPSGGQTIKDSAGNAILPDTVQPLADGQVLDSDEDGISDEEDNCPFIPNPIQEDSDVNGIGNACQDVVDLLINANFPAGQTVNAALPEDPEIGAFSLSLKLPDTQGGKVIIQTTDPGETPGNFSFLGVVVDFTAPCSNFCDISFTFTQSALDAAGITIDQVTIFHDSNENGSFEEDEAIDTVVTGDDPYTATASADFTSKFSVGGIKALALGALAGAGGGDINGGPPSFGESSFAIIEEGNEGFGGIINDNDPNTKEDTKTFKVGQKALLRFDFTEGGGIGNIDHIGLYTNVRDGQKRLDSDAYIYYDPLKSPQLTIHDPNELFSEANFDLLQKDTAADFVLKFELTFAKPMVKSDLILESWNTQRWSTLDKIPNAIEVVSSGIIQETASEPIVETSIKDIPNEITNDQAIPVWVKTNAKWWSEDKIDNKNFISGIEYLVNEGIIKVALPDTSTNVSVSELQPWIKNTAGWWADDMISNDEFLKAIEWLITNNIIQMV